MRKIDSVSSNTSAHANMPIACFTSLGPENQMAILQHISPGDKPTLRSIASTNRVMNSLATPLLMKAYIDHAESKIKTIRTSAEKVGAILLIHQKLVENADSLPVLGSETLWASLETLVLKDAQSLASVYEFLKGTQANIRSYPTTGMSLERVIAIQRSSALLTKISETLEKASKDFQAELARLIKKS